MMWTRDAMVCRLALEWLSEESAEGLAALASGSMTGRDPSLAETLEALDALMDALGVISAALVALGPDAARFGHAKYIQAQLDRDRDIEVAHMRVLAAAIAAVVDESKTPTSQTEAEEILESFMRNPKRGFFASEIAYVRRQLATRPWDEP